MQSKSNKLHLYLTPQNINNLAHDKIFVYNNRNLKFKIAPLERTSVFVSDFFVEICHTLNKISPKDLHQNHLAFAEVSPITSAVATSSK